MQLREHVAVLKLIPCNSMHFAMANTVILLKHNKSMLLNSLFLKGQNTYFHFLGVRGSPLELVKQENYAFAA